MSASGTICYWLSFSHGCDKSPVVKPSEKLGRSRNSMCKTQTCSGWVGRARCLPFLCSAASIVLVSWSSLMLHRVHNVNDIYISRILLWNRMTQVVIRQLFHLDPYILLENRSGRMFSRFKTYPFIAFHKNKEMYQSPTFYHRLVTKYPKTEPPFSTASQKHLFSLATLGIWELIDALIWHIGKLYRYTHFIREKETFPISSEMRYFPRQRGS